MHSGPSSFFKVFFQKLTYTSAYFTHEYHNFQKYRPEIHGNKIWIPTTFDLVVSVFPYNLFVLLGTLENKFRPRWSAAVQTSKSPHVKKDGRTYWFRRTDTKSKTVARCLYGAIGSREQTDSLEYITTITVG